MTHTAPSSASWPPPFTVRVSARARHARLRAVPGKGLEVVIPQGSDPAKAAALVCAHRDWVERTLRRLGLDMPENATALAPKAVVLHGSALSLPVVCAGEEAPGTDEATYIRLRAPRHETQACLGEAQTWLAHYARRFLQEETATLAARHGFVHTALRVRRQKSRWGSCSAKGGINLNTCLVFLPLDLCRFVIVHELVHTRHHNHGQHFWKALFAAESNALALDRKLRTAWKFVPAWVWQS